MKEKQLQNIIRKVKKGLRSQVLWLCVLSVTASMLTMSFTNNKLGGTRFMFWNFEETTHQAKFRKKPIFVFIYSPTCLQSQRMDDIFKMPKVAELYNKSFVNDKFDTENIGKRMQAIRWGVKSYPSFVFFSNKFVLEFPDLFSV
jgi:thioredoxin-related protein